MESFKCIYVCVRWLFLLRLTPPIYRSLVGNNAQTWQPWLERFSDAASVQREKEEVELLYVGVVCNELHFIVK